MARLAVRVTWLDTVPLTQTFGIAALVLSLLGALLRLPEIVDYLRRHFGKPPLIGDRFTRDLGNHTVGKPPMVTAPVPRHEAVRRLRAIQGGRS